MHDDAPPLLAAAPPVSIRYVLTRGDLVVANARAIFMNRFLMGLWAVLITIISFSMLREPKVADQSILYKVFFVLFVAAVYFIIFFGLTLIVTSLMVLVRKNRGVLGEHRITLTAEGLVESTECNESLHRWNAYHRTVVTARYLFLFPTEGQIHLIPRKKPLLEGDLAEFQAALKTYTGGR